MIFTDRKITIRNGKSMINEPVILYRGDYEVSIRFTIMESKFRFKSGVNLVDSEKASHGQLAILTPYGDSVISEIVKCEDGTVTFTLTKEMIDQLEEVGLYSFQIRLFDYYRESRISIPPVEFGIEVREPVASEDHNNIVGDGMVGYAIAKYPISKVTDGLNEDYDGPTFDDDGQYNKTDWEIGDRISQGKLNKIEDAIDQINQNEKNDTAALDKRVTNNFNVMQNQIDNLVLESGGDSNLEVVQARGQYNTLNNRLSTEEEIRKSNLASLTNKEISDCFNFNSNMWIDGDVSIEYTKGITWKYKDISISGFEIGEEYVVGLTTAINHFNPNYIIEVLGDGRRLFNIYNTNETYKFTPKTETITLRFQTVAGEESTSGGLAVYSGIYIRKGNLSLKDSACKRKYDISEIERMSDVVEIPVYIITDATFTKTGGTGAYNNHQVNYEVKEDTVYTLGYEELTGNRLSHGEPTVIYTCYNSEGEQVQGNTNILFVGLDRKATITTPPGTSRLQLSFMVTMNTPFYEEFTVTWEGVYLYEGVSKTIVLKEDVIPKSYEKTINVEIEQINRLNEILKVPNYLIQNVTIIGEGGLKPWTNVKRVIPIQENSVYTISYEKVTNNRLNEGEPIVVYTCEDSNGSTIKNNTTVLSSNGSKYGIIEIPQGATQLTLMFIITLSNTYDALKTVTWEGVSLLEGNKDNITIKEEALPTIPRRELFELHLPKDIYVAIGYPLEIYNHTLCRCINIENYIFEWGLPKGGGKAFKDKILLEPSDSLSGSTDILTLNIYDLEYELLDTQTSNIHYIKPDNSLTPSSTRKVLCIGDSLTDISVWREELYTRFNNDIATNRIEYLGTLGTSPYFNEGHSGWSLNNYLTDSSEGWNGNYKIKVSSAPTISPKKQYKFGGKIFEYEKIEVKNGDIWVYFNRISGGGFISISDSPCTEVDSAISGDSSISFTDCEVTSFNPFYNNGFDCKHYSDTYLDGVIPDDVVIWLGTNGGTPSMSLESVKNKVSSQMDKYKTIIDNIKNNWVDTKIFISYLHYRPNQDGQGYTSGIANSKAWDNYVFEFNTQLYNTFKEYSNIIFIPVGQTFDRVNNYPAREININTRNNKKTIVAGDTVHMARDTGFLQVSDAIYGAYVNNI